MFLCVLSSLLLLAFQVVHPIHDQTFYLTLEHKRRLKEEFGLFYIYLMWYFKNLRGFFPSDDKISYYLGIEPWTFVQKLGDAVLIPAGCPHQVRNIKVTSSIDVLFIFCTYRKVR